MTNKIQQHVDSVEVTVTGLDSEVQVQQFDLTVAVNDIPRITLEILPVEAENGKTEASSPSFSEITKLYHKLFSKSLDLQQKATIRIKIDSKDEGCKKQELELKDWILTDVGLSSVSTYAAPSLVAVLQHPIVSLTRTGTIYETPMNNLDSIFMDLQSMDMVGLMDKVLTLMSSPAYPFYPLPKTDSHDKAKAFRTSLSSQKNLPGTYLKGSGGLFLQQQAQLTIRLLKVALSKIMQPFRGSVSTWYTIISKVCPYCLMQVRPTYDQEKLSLEPLQPWYAKDAHKIDEHLIESIDLVARDPDPICGVSFERKFPGEPTFNKTTLAWELVARQGTKTELSSYAFFIPDKVQPDSRKYGRIVDLGSNAVISMIKQLSGPVSSLKIDAYEKISSTGQLDMENAHAKAMFHALYRKNCRAAMTTTLMFKDSDGRMIYPGEILTISADGKDLFSGYLSRMTVSGSTTNGCLAKYEMNYARSADDKNLLVEGNTKNECFKS